MGEESVPLKPKLMPNPDTVITVTVMAVPTTLDTTVTTEESVPLMPSPRPKPPLSLKLMPIPDMVTTVTDTAVDTTVDTVTDIPTTVKLFNQDQVTRRFNKKFGSSEIFDEVQN